MASPAVALGTTHSVALGALHSAAADAARIPHLSALVPASAFPSPAPLRIRHRASHSRRTRVSASLFGSSSPSASSASQATAAAETAGKTVWVQKTIELPPYKRGCHIITSQIMRAVPEIAEFRVGIANIFVLHTSASLTINENASPDVPLDMEDALNRIAPEGNHYRHLDEGYDDMPAHVKSSLMGCSLTVPIMAGRFKLGTWQGIYLNEHRNYGGARQLCITIQGEKRADGRVYR
ncbi:unnamed protein product [Closterium sp. Yama58-4]|nr:unnamed protein product [Closterium sp. Yama58-4]